MPEGERGTSIVGEIADKPSKEVLDNFDIDLSLFKPTLPARTAEETQW